MHITIAIDCTNNGGAECARTKMPRDAASNECIRLTKICVVPDRDWSLASSPLEQQKEAERAAARARGLRDARRPAQAWTYGAVPEDRLNEHDHLVPWRLCWILGVPTAGEC